MKIKWEEDREVSQWDSLGAGWKATVFSSSVEVQAVISWDTGAGTARFRGSFPFDSTNPAARRIAISTAKSMIEALAVPLEEGQWRGL